MTTIDNTTLGLVAGDNESFVTRITTATITVLKASNGALNGVVINSHSSGAMLVYDNNTISLGGSLKFGTISFGASERFIPFFGARFGNGIVVYTTGTVDISVLSK